LNTAWELSFMVRCNSNLHLTRLLQDLAAYLTYIISFYGNISFGEPAITYCAFSLCNRASKLNFGNSCFQLLKFSLNAAMKTYNKPLTFQVCTVHMLYIWGGKLSCSKLHTRLPQ